MEPILPSYRQPDPGEVKFLVSEQPGFILSFFAILIALILGLAFRNTFSEANLRPLFEQAAAKVDSRFQIQFQGVKVVLARGVFPDLSVEVRGVRFSSTDTCLADLEGELDFLRIPLSGWEILLGRVSLHRVDLDRARVSLKQLPREDCLSASASTEVDPREPDLTSKGDINPSLRFILPEAHPVRVVTLKSIEVQVQSYPRAQLRFNDTRIERRQTSYWARTKATLLDEVGSRFQPSLLFEGELLSTGDFIGKIWGQWREGQIEGRWEITSGKKEARVAAKNLPASDLWQKVSAWGPNLPTLDLRGAWVSFELLASEEIEEAENQSDQQVQELKSYRLSFNQLTVEGEHVALRASSVEMIRAAKEWKISPFELEVLRLELSAVLGPASWPSYIDRPGSFSGVFWVKSPTQVELLGFLNHLSFIFSNQGQRTTQEFTSIKISGLYDGESIQLKTSEFRPISGVAFGQIQFNHHFNSKISVIDAKIDELILSPQVQALMTNTGSLGSWKLDVQGSLGPQFDLISISGIFEVDNVLAEGFRLSSARVLVETSNLPPLPRAMATGEGGVSNRFEKKISIKAQGLKIERESSVGQLLKSKVQSDASGNERFVPGVAYEDALGGLLIEGIGSKLFEIQFRLVDFSEVSWLVKSTRIGEFLMSSEGGWLPSGEVFGFLELSNARSKKPVAKLNLLGNRSDWRLERIH